MTELDNKLSRLWVDFISENNTMHIEEKENLELFDSYVKNIYANEEYDLAYLVNFVISNYVNDIIKPINVKYDDNKLMIYLQKLSKNIKRGDKVNIIINAPFDDSVKSFLYYFFLIYEEELLNISDVNLINNLATLFSISTIGLSKEDLNEEITKQLAKVGIKDYSNIMSNFILRNKKKIFSDIDMKNKSNFLIESPEQIEEKQVENNFSEVVREIEEPLVELDVEEEYVEKVKGNESVDNLYMTVKLKDKYNVSGIPKFEINLEENDSYRNIDIKVKRYFNNYYNNRALGVPSTGKSYYYNEGLIKKTGLPIGNLYKISIEKGINGTTSNRLILGYGYKDGIPVDKEGILLKTLKKAIKNPYQTYVLVLEDVHNQNMNDLLSPIISIMKNTDRYDIPMLFQQYNKVKHELWIKELQYKYMIEDKISFDSYKRLIAFIKEFITLNNQNDLENKLSYPVSILLPNIINDNVEEEYFLPNNLIINMTSNYNQNSILEVEWEDRINSVIFEPVSSKIRLNKYSHEDAQPRIIDIYIKINELLENELYKYEYLEAEKLLLGHYILMNEDMKITSVGEYNMIKKMLFSVNNSLEYYGIYNKREIIISIIISLLEIDLFEEYVIKKLGSNNIFKIISNVSDIHSLEDNEKIRLSKSIKNILK